jgi:NAD-reducing hydrogenase small subunit
MSKKQSIATVSLAGCFGCHMSFLDLDTKLVDLIELVDITKSPLTDIKKFPGKVNIGLIEGGVCNDENVEVLKMFRENCEILVSMGECAIMGGLPALRNNVSLKDCLEEAYINTPTTDNHEEIIPYHPDIPKILDKVYPCHEVVKIDYYIPGCPPSAETIWAFLEALITGKELKLDYKMVKYD